jgi:hypothetical protein
MSLEGKGTAYNNNSSNAYKDTWRHKPDDSTHFSNVSEHMGRDLKLDNEAIFSGSRNNFVNTYVNSNVFLFMLFIHYNIIFVLLIHIFLFYTYHYL